MSRDTSVSQASATSLAGPRPMLSDASLRRELDDPLVAVAVEHQQERRPAALGLEPLGHLARRTEPEGGRQRSHAPR